LPRDLRRVKRAEIGMDLGLRDKVIMVAAASRGLGFAIARAVALEGARVSIASPTESRIHEAASKLR